MEKPTSEIQNCFWEGEAAKGKGKNKGRKIAHTRDSEVSPPPEVAHVVERRTYEGEPRIHAMFVASDLRSFLCTGPVSAIPQAIAEHWFDGVERGGAATVCHRLTPELLARIDYRVDVALASDCSEAKKQEIRERWQVVREFAREEGFCV